MSKGHQAHRRRSYGRRQHELHERRVRQEVWDGWQIGVEDVDDPDVLDLFDALRPRRASVAEVLATRPRWLAEAS
jgi:hypothetical protein